MINTIKEKDTTLVNEVVEFLTDQGYENIKADCQDYEQPNSFVNKQEGKEFTPDVTAEKNGRRYYFELGTKTRDIDELKTKWKLLDTMAKIKKMGFRVITMRGHIQFSRDLMRQLGFSPKRLVRIDA